MNETILVGREQASRIIELLCALAVQTPSAEDRQLALKEAGRLMEALHPHIDWPQEER